MLPIHCASMACTVHAAQCRLRSIQGY